jgi:pantetheine-phosphate adenylyltransferase
VTPARVALFPGSFDPFHNGHLDVVEQAHALFGSVIVVAMGNPQKVSGLLSYEDRVGLIEASCSHLPGVTTAQWSGLVVDAVKALGADVIVKGLRTVADFETETTMAHTNRAVAGVATVFVPCDPARGFVASSYIRDISRLGGDISSLVPVPVAARLKDIAKP